MHALALCFLLIECVAPAQDGEPAHPQRYGTSRHHLLRFEERVELPRSGQAVEMPPIQAPEPFDECLISWNADAPAGAGFQVELRVGRGEEWSPWLFVGEWGTIETPPSRATAFEHGEIDVDLFHSRELFEHAQVRVQAFAGGDPLQVVPQVVTVRRIVVCFTRTEARAGSENRMTVLPSSSRLLAVAARSSEPALSSPACLAMVLAYRGIDVPTAEVAGRAQDALHGGYDHGPLAVQAAYSFGVPGYLARYANWSQVQKNLMQDVPLIARVAFDGSAQGPQGPQRPQRHWVVIVGLDADKVHVLDPAARTLEEVARAYDLVEFAGAWFGNGGVAYVLLPP